MSLVGGEQGLRALLQRAVALDAQALGRVQELPDGSSEVFVTTPFDVLAARRVRGHIDGVEDVFRIQDYLAGHSAGNMVQAWPGALPPYEGFEQLDIVPVDVVHQLAEQGRSLARQFSGPLGPPKSLLDQTVIEVSGDNGSAKVSMRVIFACTSLGLIPGVATHPDIPRHLRVSTLGRWTRVDAPFGSVYQQKGIGLLVAQQR